MTTLKHRWAAALAAGAIAVTGAGAGVALAPVAAYAQEAATSTIDKSQSATLHIHKFSNNKPGEAGDGTKISDTDNLGTPLQGAVFKVQKVTNVDLTTNEGWQKAAAIQKGEETADLAEGTSKPTGADGSVDFSGLDLGLYKVTETSAPAGHEISTEPFYVTLPMTNPSNSNEWMYEVHVYPKNKKQENVITKTVEDADATTVGDTLTYTVTGKLPSAEKLAKVELTDIYPSARLENPAVTRVALGDGTVLADGDDYTLDTSQDGLATVKLTENGRAKADQLTGEQRTVVAEFTFDLKDPQDTDGLDAAENRAMVNAKGEGDNTPDPKPTDPDNPNVIPPGEGTKTYYGNVVINKTGDENEQLNNVKFDLYRCDNADSLGNKVKSDITVTAGKATINSLHVNDWVNGEAGTTNPTGYCLVETQAAEGYALLAKPYYFQVKKDGQEEISLTSLDVKNTKNRGGFELPLTGGTGVTMLLIIGGLIMAGGALYMVRNNRRENKA